MPRKYDCLIRFYASWFADFADDSKGFTFDEIGRIVTKIAEAQMKRDAAVVNELPATIRRGLQMATLVEQLTRIIERADKCKEKGSVGGRTTAERSAAAANAAAEERERRFALMRENEARKRDVEEKRRDNNNRYYRECAKKDGVDYITWMRRKRTDDELYQLWLDDDIRAYYEFPEWLIYRGFRSLKNMMDGYKGFLRRDTKAAQPAGGAPDKAADAPPLPSDD